MLSKSFYGCYVIMYDNDIDSIYFYYISDIFKVGYKSTDVIVSEAHNNFVKGGGENNKWIVTTTF